ncbi:L,D-transpeptidase family protein [Sphingomonas flavescens]|uniref:L,D-transpeptidase family protein n=1 Tax=Sphingomonas flavescens TaxID=3132797 RepID=UPI002805CC0B|nr:L,D-transpeptidase family protein [Sphingomonas limnosediminicola]
MPRWRSFGRLIGGAAFFLLGGTTAATLSVARQPAHPAAARAVDAATPSANRIEVSPAAMRQALAAGQIDRPVKSVLQVPARMQYGDFKWDDAGVPAGPLWIRVDTRAQLISVFRAGHEIGTAVILYGADGLETPAGKFPILAKLKDHHSATYDAPMPYTLRLTKDGVAIHASDVRWGLATHGCVGVPEGFAKQLFAAASVGDEVFVVGNPKRA